MSIKLTNSQFLTSLADKIQNKEHGFKDIIQNGESVVWKKFIL